MSRKLFYSRKFFLINLILVGVIAGFALSFVMFGCSTELSPGEEAKAQQQQDGTAAAEEGIENLKQMQYSFRSVAQDVLPVVVELKVTEIIKQQVPQERGWPWGFLFPDEDNGDNGDSQPQEREFRSQGLGSGVIVRQQGDTYYVITNSHVVGDADEIRIVLHDESEYTASLVGKDQRMDLAMVQFETDEDLPVADLGDSDDLYVGDWVLAVGSPFGFVSSVTAGIVSAKGRTGPEQNISEFIQTDAAINKGNSGGALVNLNGEVIGINTWIAAPTGGNVGVGFAIPINSAKKAIHDFIEEGEVQYGWLGVTVSDLPQEIASELGLEENDGAFIHNVYEDSPADRGGIRPGDFVTKINGMDVSNRNEVVRVVGNLKEGEKASFTVIRFGEEKNLTVTIGKREDRETILSRQNKLWPGMSVVPLNEQLRNELELESSTEGIFVSSVEQGTKAYGVGLRRYVVITEINGTAIETVADFYKIISNPDTEEFDITYLQEGKSYQTKLER
jgi:Do/DeqQ family serine protease